MHPVLKIQLIFILSLLLTGNFVYTHREILFNQTEIRLYLPFSDWFGTKRTVSVWFQIDREMLNTIWFRFDLIRFGKDFSVCRTCVTSTNRFFRSSSCTDVTTEPEYRLLKQQRSNVYSVSAIRGAQLRASLKPPVHHSTIVLKVLRGPLIEPALVSSLILQFDEILHY